MVADVANRIRNGESIPYRPVLPESTEMGKAVLDLIKQCWSEDVEARPWPKHIRATIRKLTGGESVPNKIA